MSKGWKIALIVFGCLVLGTLSMCGACFYWVKSNIPSAEEMKKRGEKMKEEAATFAASHTDSECVDDALVRVEQCQGKGIMETSMCGAMVNVYLEACMGGAKQTDTVCAAVPKSQNIMEIASWAASTCSSHSKQSDQTCANLMQIVHRVCQARSAGKAE